MGVAPLVSGRRGGWSVLWTRLRAIAWVAWSLVALLVVLGVRHPLVLGAYFLAALAAGTAVRSLLHGMRAARQREEGWWTGLLGPSAGGMVVHLGVVLLAVGIVTSTSYVTRRDVALGRGQSTVVAGQVITYDRLQNFRTHLKYGTEIVVTVDRHAVIYPAVTTFIGRADQSVGTPAIDSNLARDVYVTFDAIGEGATSGANADDHLPRGHVLLGVTVEPLLAWLWIGGLVIGIGSALSFARRRKGAGA
jgi:cytochrome c-type biogenesis protein CcmF